MAASPSFSQSTHRLGVPVAFAGRCQSVFPSFADELVTSTMQVPLLDLKGQYAPLRAEIEAAIREVCDAQRFVLGPRVAELEADVARYSQTKHGLGLSSGTDAL